MATLWERVELLERQVGELLESGQAPLAGQSSRAAATPVDTADDGRFYALNALKQELPAPGGVVYAGAIEMPDGRQAEWQDELPTETLVNADWTELGETIAALGHSTRLQLLQAVLQGVDNAADLAELDEVGSTGQVYHHLRTLISAGWLRSAGRGRYEIPANRVVSLLALLLAARR